MSANNRKFQELDQRFEHFIESVRIDFVESELTQEKRAARRKRADVSDLEFCKIYYPNIFSLPWNRLHKQVAEIKSGMWTVSGFRECGKSAVVYIGKGIKHICLRRKGVFNINCATDEISVEKTASLYRIMMRNRLLMYDYDIEVQQERKGWYIINGVPMIAGSVNKGLRNIVDDEFTRIGISINDDLYDRNSVTSEYLNAKTVDFIESEVRGQLMDGGLSVTMANAIHETAPICQLREKHPNRHISLPAITEDGKSGWPEYSRKVEAGAESITIQMKTAEDWERWRDLEEIPWDVWEGEYMDSPSLRGDIFTPDWLRVNVNTIQVVATISAIDPSHGQSPDACYKAISTVSLLSNDDFIAEDLYLRRENYLSVFDYVDALRARFPVWKALLFENDFAQFHLAEPYYQMWMAQRQKVLPIVLHYTSQLQTDQHGYDKDSRILSLVYPLQTGKLTFRQGVLETPDGKRWRAQLLSYGKAKTKLDGPDSMATAVIMGRRWGERASFKPLKTRQWSRVQSWFRKG